MIIYEERPTTMRVKWEEAVGATNYMLLYRAINATEPSVEKEVRRQLREREQEKERRQTNCCTDTHTRMLPMTGYTGPLPMSPDSMQMSQSSDESQSERSQQNTQLLRLRGM